jgi:hypothetical protein
MCINVYYKSFSLLKKDTVRLLYNIEMYVPISNQRTPFVKPKFHDVRRARFRFLVNDNTVIENYRSLLYTI